MGRYSDIDAPVRNRSNGLPNNSIDDQWFAQRMQLLSREGGAAFFETPVENLAELALSDLDDYDMLQTYTGALTPIEVEKMKVALESNDSKHWQRAIVQDLHPETQSLLIAAGYEMPEIKKNRGFWDRFRPTNWFDYEIFGHVGPFEAARYVTAPLGAVVGTTSRILWNVADYTYETGMQLFRTTNAILQGSSKYKNPATWKEVWDSNYHRESSFFMDAVDEARELVGDKETERLKVFFKDGLDGVWESYLDEGLTDQQARSEFESWVSRLGEKEYEHALAALGNNVNSEYLTMIQAYNAIHPGNDITPESTAGRIVGTSGSLAVGILLDPLTYVGKIHKLYKGIRLQMKPNMAGETIQLLREANAQLIATSPEANQLFKTVDEVSVLNNDEWRSRWKTVLEEGAPERGAGRFVSQILRTDRLWPSLFKRQLNSFNRVMFRVVDAFKYEKAIANIKPSLYAEALDNSTDFGKNVRSSLGLDESAVITTEDVTHRMIDREARKRIKGAGLEQLKRDFPQLTSLIDHMRYYENTRVKQNWVYFNDEIVINVDTDAIVLTELDGQMVPAIKNNAAGNQFIERAGLTGDMPWEWTKGPTGDELYILPSQNIRPVSGLDSIDGYFNFLSDGIGMGLTYKGAASGVDPDLILFPAAFGIGTRKNPIVPAIRQIINKTVDFANPTDEMFDAFDIATGEFLRAQGLYVTEAIRAAIKSNELIIKNPKFREALLNDNAFLAKVLQANDNDKVIELAGKGFDRDVLLEDLTSIDTTFRKYNSISSSVLKNSGEHDLFFNFHEYNKQDVLGNFKAKRKQTAVTDKSGRTTFVDEVDELGNPVWVWKPTFEPFRMARRARRNYVLGKVHRPGSINNEVQAVVKEQSVLTTGAKYLKTQAAGFAVAAGYYPAKFAQKMTTYMPTQPFIDLSNRDTMLKEFSNLVEMGVMANMPQHVRDEYVRLFINADEGHRWMIQTEFFMDFLGRSGALLHGGSGVTDWIHKFIKHSQARYSLIPNKDQMNLHGVEINRLINPAKLHEGQMSALNVIPNYKELAGVARYMSWYRKLGWGLRIPLIDKFLSKWWRPAVLIRLGYVARNGGEELASWMFREGPQANIQARLIKKSTGYVPVWDKYGLKTFKHLDDLDPAEAAKVQHGIIWGGVSRIWRAFNEIIGVGDMALTNKAIKESIESNSSLWGFLSLEERTQILEVKRASLVADRNEKVLSSLAVGLFDFAEQAYQGIMQPVVKGLHTLGLPTRKEAARKILDNMGVDSTAKVNILRQLYSHPTFLDEHMKHILGTFDSHLDTSNATLDHMLRSSGSNRAIAQLVKLPINYHGTEMQFVENLGTEIGLHAPEYAIASAQRLAYLSDSPATSRAVFHLMHYADPAMNAKLAYLADDIRDLIKVLPDEYKKTFLDVERRFDRRSRTWVEEIVIPDSSRNHEMIVRFLQSDFAKPIVNRLGNLRDALHSTPLSGVSSGSARNVRPATAALKGEDLNIIFSDAVDVAFRTLDDLLADVFDLGHRVDSGLGDAMEGIDVVAKNALMEKHGLTASQADELIAWGFFLEEANITTSVGARPDTNNLFMTLYNLVSPESPLKDLNTTSWLLTAIPDAGRINTAKISGNWLQIRDGARQEIINFLYGTPMGQQLLQSTVRSAAGFNPGNGPLQMPLPEGMTRTFLPFIPADMIEDLVKRLNLTDPNSVQNLNNSLYNILAPRLENLGYKRNLASKIMLMLRRDNVETSYANIKAFWGSEQTTHVPLMFMTTDHRVAEQISESIAEWIIRSRSKTDNIPAPIIGTRDISQKGIVQSATEAALAKGDVDIPLRGNFVGAKYDEGAKTFVRADAVDFPDGLQREVVWGVGSESVAPGVGVHIVPVSEGKPVVHKGVVIRNSTNNDYMVVRKQDFDNGIENVDPDEWFIEEEFVMTSNDLYNSASELSYHLVEEIDHLLTNLRVRKADETAETATEIFYPWVEQVNGGAGNRPVDAGAVLELTSHAQWWDKAPARIPHHVPVTSEGARLGERISKQWDTLLRNYFDGVVNPLIGAMVREPLFHHYFIKAWDQTVDVEKAFHHSPNAYPTLTGKNSPFKQLIVTNADGQIRIDDLEEFINYEMGIAHADPDTPLSIFALTLLYDNEPQSIRGAARMLLKEIDGMRYAGEVVDEGFANVVEAVAKSRDAEVIQFKHLVLNRKLQIDRHRDVAAQRALYITSNFIDDHRIRSQFQGMVGTAVPFWFAEDQFLRRVGRSLKHNPLAFRNANLWMNAGTYSGLVQEDKNGFKRVVIPGSAMMTRAAVEMMSRTPLVNRVFGGDLATYIQQDMSFNINMLPGYNFAAERDREGFVESVLVGGEDFLSGDFGFGPMLAVPLLWSSQVNPDVLHVFEDNLIGGRYQEFAMPDVEVGEGASFDLSAGARQALDNVTPALIKYTGQLAATVGVPNPFEDDVARSKALMDVLTLMWMQGDLPDEEAFQSASDPELMLERLIQEVEQEANTLTLLQFLTWFSFTGKGTLGDVILNSPEAEMASDFFEILNMGYPYEEAYKIWRLNTMRENDGEWNPFVFTPFFTSKNTSKIPLSAVPATQAADEWLVSNAGFVTEFTYGSAFFMPLSLGSEDNEYSAVARSRAVAYGLYETQTPLEWLKDMYVSHSQAEYYREINRFDELIYAGRARGLDVSQLKSMRAQYSEQYLSRHPLLEAHILAGESRIKRDATLRDFKAMVANPDLIPDAPNKEDVFEAITYIVALDEELSALKNIPADMTSTRNEIKLRYYRLMDELSTGNAHLNTLFWNVFVPLLDEGWIAKMKAGLLEFPDERNYA